MEHFLAEVVDPATNVDERKIDYYSYQTAPEDSERLLECSAIKDIVKCTENTVKMQLIGVGEECDSPYVVTRVTVMYSKPSGLPQKLHIDDNRNDTTIQEQGEMLSAIVALQQGTRLDIARDNGERLTYSIDPTSMFLFSGMCKHGGSGYIRHNVRLHMYLLPVKHTTGGALPIENVIIVNQPCPIDGCEYSKEGETFNQSQLYYHWHKYHLAEIGLSVGKFIQERQGIKILQCKMCKKGFSRKRGLAKHLKGKCRAQKTLK